MFTVIYSFLVKPGHEEDFELAWRDLTLLIFEYAESLGSRLHKESEQHYIAYAQWPDKSTWESSGDKLPEASHDVRKQMREACEKIETLYQLEVVDDLFAQVED